MNRLALAVLAGVFACGAVSVGQQAVDDGKPPRWIEQHDEDSAPGPHDIFKRIIPAHWACDKGYEPDGLEVAWPGGVFTPRPARCKASTP